MTRHPIYRSTLVACLLFALPSRAEELNYRPFSIGAEVGTTGIGIQGSWRFSDHFGLRAGADYFSYSHDDTIEGVPYDAKLRLSSQPLLLDIHPWKSSSFRVSVGLALNQTRIRGTATATAEQSIDIGSGTLDPGDSVTLRIKHQPLSPYLAIGGQLYLDKAKHWSVSGELGAMYTGSASVSLKTNSGAISADDLREEKSEIEDFADKVPLWPVLKLGVNFHF